MTERPKAFVVLGIVFLAIGALSFLTVAQGWYLSNTILPRAGIYGLMDLLVAYALFARHWWLRPALAVNATGLLVLLGLRYTYAPANLSALLFAGFGLLLAAGLAYYIHSRRAVLLYDRASYVLLALFLLAWGAGYFYALSDIIPSL